MFLLPRFRKFFIYLAWLSPIILMLFAAAFCGFLGDTMMPRWHYTSRLVALVDLMTSIKVGMTADKAKSKFDAAGIEYHEGYTICPETGKSNPCDQPDHPVTELWSEIKTGMNGIFPIRVDIQVDVQDEKVTRIVAYKPRKR